MAVPISFQHFFKRLLNVPAFTHTGIAEGDGLHGHMCRPDMMSCVAWKQAAGFRKRLHRHSNTLRQMGLQHPDQRAIVHQNLGIPKTTAPLHKHHYKKAPLATIWVTRLASPWLWQTPSIIRQQHLNYRRSQSSELCGDAPGAAPSRSIESKNSHHPYLADGSEHGQSSAGILTYTILDCRF